MGITESMVDLEFNIKRLSASRHIPIGSYTRESMRLEVFNRTADDLVMILTAKILACEEDVQVIDVESTKVPATWWDHVKKRWLPAWAKKRWPVIETEIVTSQEKHVYRMCPHMDIPNGPKDPRHIYFMRPDLKPPANVVAG